MRLVLLALAASLAVPALAQTDRPTTDGISIDAARRLGDGFGPNGTVRSEARVPLGPWTAVAEVPVAVGKFFQESENAIRLGNSYVGVARSLGLRAEAEIGVRLPLASRTAQTLGAGADPLDSEAFAYRTTSVSATLRGRVPVTETTTLHLSASPMLSHSSRGFQPFPQFPDSTEPSRFNAALTGSVLAEGRFPTVAVGGGFAFRRDAEQSEFFDSFFGTGSGAEAVGHAVFLGSAVRPGVQVRLPFDSAFDLDGALVGLSLDVPLR